MNKYFFLWAVAALTLSSCSDDDEPTAERYPLTIAVSENPLLDEAGNPVTTTRGTVITTGTLASFYANYQDTKYTATKSSEGTWSTSPSYWPFGVEKSTMIDFYAYSAGTFNNESSPYVSFTVDENVSAQNDLLVAHRNVSYNETGGKVWLTFDHACAAVDFQIQITNTLRTKLGGDLKVNSITLQGIANKGEYHYGEGWKSLSVTDSPPKYSLNNSEMDISTTPTAANNGTLFMIPQTLGDNAKLVVNYKKSSNVEAKTAEISLKGRTWEAGKQYIVTIKLGTGLIK